MAANPFSLEGQSVLISGAGGGIGQALVAAFNAAGARVYGADRDAASLAGLDLAGTMIAEQGDAAGMAEATARFIDQQGAPDIVVANAGWTRAEHFGHLDAESWSYEVDVNLNGTYRMVDPLVTAMAKKGGGAVVIISSVNALSHYGNPAYAAAKAGLIAYAKAIAVERGRDGIRANIVCPGSVRTPAWDHRLAANPRLLDKVLPHYPLNRLVSPAEVANAAVFLSSPAASGITGVTLSVDAGLTAGNLRFVDEVLRADS
jgi:NAD(P)-dependent dehydrogenase (short-subunit alcohol dehydrogenase family)